MKKRFVLFFVILLASLISLFAHRFMNWPYGQWSISDETCSVADISLFAINEKHLFDMGFTGGRTDTGDFGYSFDGNPKVYIMGSERPVLSDLVESNPVVSAYTQRFENHPSFSPNLQGSYKYVHTVNMFDEYGTIVMYYYSDSIKEGESGADKYLYDLFVNLQ